MKTKDALRRRMSNAYHSQSNSLPPVVSPGQRCLNTTHPNKLWPTTLGLALALALALAPAARAATLIVTNTADTGPGTLRTLVAGASSGDTLNFAAALSGQTITLTSGQITLVNVITLDASSLPGGITVSGNNVSPVFFTQTGSTITMNALTISDGVASFGGGLQSSGTTLLTGCTFTANSATIDGGAIHVQSGTLTAMACTFATNTSPRGAVNVGPAAANFDECTFSGNTATSIGGGAVNTSSTVAIVTLVSCTVSGNQATGAAVGGGLRALTDSTLTITNCIVAGNTCPTVGSENFSGTITVSGPNLTSGDPQLAALGNYGGPTQTMPPLPGSPAIDSATNGTGFTTDQRGYPRIVGPSADLGAVEGGSGPVVTTTADAGAGSLRDAISNAPVSIPVTITFVTNLSGQTITLTSGQLTLSNTSASVTIDASGLPGGIQINGNQKDRIFYVNSSGTVVLNSLTITNGKAKTSTTAGGGIYILGGGVTLNDCTLSGNTTSGGGFGGGIANASGTLTLNECTLAGNSAASAAGNNGGAISFGAAGGTLALNQCTVSQNTAVNFGGGIYQMGGSLAMSNSIVAGNTRSSGNDITNTSGAITFSGVNLTSGNPLLAALGNYGGPTQTMPPLPGSPAIDGCTGGTDFATDQRGFPRVVGAYADIGAVEVQSPAASPPVLENITVPAGGGANGLQFTFTNTPVADFTVLTATNVSLPLTNWTVLGEVLQPAPGQYQFTDPQPATNAARFYRVSSP